MNRFKKFLSLMLVAGVLSSTASLFGVLPASLDGVISDVERMQLSKLDEKFSVTNDGYAQFTRLAQTAPTINVGLVVSLPVRQQLVGVLEERIQALGLLISAVNNFYQRSHRVALVEFEAKLAKEKAGYEVELLEQQRLISITPTKESTVTQQQNFQPDVVTQVGRFVPSFETLASLGTFFTAFGTNAVSHGLGSMFNVVATEPTIGATALVASAIIYGTVKGSKALARKLRHRGNGKSAVVTVDGDDVRVIPLTPPVELAANDPHKSHKKPHGIKKNSANVKEKMRKTRRGGSVNSTAPTLEQDEDAGMNE